MQRVASFDVFDTVLTRAVGSPESVFLLLGRRLIMSSQVTCSPEAFAIARVEAERRAYHNTGDACTLATIYDELASALQLSEPERQRLADEECATEAALIRVVPSVLARIQQARALGQRVVFVSDMYLPVAFMQQQLARHGLWQSGDRCYVSCEHKCSKRSGRLLSEMLLGEGVRPELVVHHGNSPEVDIRPATRLGLSTALLCEANPNRYERLLDAHAHSTEGLAAVLAGASRLARLSLDDLDAKAAALRDVAAGVTAPTLVAYTLWVLNRAQRLGLQRLYFLSRDGQVLLGIASRLAKSLGLTCELRYLFASRQAWNLAATTCGSDAELAWIWDSTDFLSVNSLLARVGLAAEQVVEPLRLAGFNRPDWSRALSPLERLALKQVLNIRTVRGLIVQKAKNKRQVLLKYLRQEGVLDPSPWGIVDLGWYGSLQNSLTAVLAESSVAQPIGFYFALWKGDIVDTTAVQREAFYFDQRLGRGYLNAVPDLIPLMEAFCVADHGTVIDFVEHEGFVEPELSTPVNEPVIRWGLPLMRHTIDAFVDNLLLDANFVNPRADLRGAITDVLRAFWLQPSTTEARTWADFPWEDGLGRETYHHPLAQSYRWVEVLNGFSKGRVEPHHRASWFAGSLILSPLIIRVVLRGFARLMRQVRALRYRVKLRLGIVTQA